MRILTDTPAGSVVSIETIQFQSTLFFKELTMAVGELRKSAPFTKTTYISPYNNNQDKNEAAEKVIAVIKHHTNLSIGLLFSPLALEPMVGVNVIDKNNVLINSFRKNGMDSNFGFSLLKFSHKAVRGTVSLVSGKVTGIFETISSNITFPNWLLQDSEYSDAELAAFYLHELGHVFTYFEYIARSVTTNQILHGIVEGMLGAKTNEDREIIFKAAANDLLLKDLDAKTLSTVKNPDVVQVVFIDSITKQIRSELGSDIYDFSSWEALSDLYATSQGAGRDLAVAISRANKKYGSGKSFRSLPQFLAMEAVKLLLAVSVVGIPISLLMVAIDSGGDSTDDQIGVRMKRIRNHIVENLKDTDLPPEDATRLHDDLAAIDHVMDKVKDRRQLANLLLDVFNSEYRQARSQYVLQRDLEDIAANDLFIKASVIKQLA
jgi:hypothetical protein